MSTKKTIQIQKNEAPERRLIEGANVLINGFKKPARFLSFITEAMSWISEDDVSKNKGTDRVFFLRQLIQGVLQSWLRNDQEVTKNIANGLRQIADFGGYEGYMDEVAIITKGFSVSILGCTCPSDYANDYLNGIQTMFQIGSCIESYEDEMNEIMKKKEKLSEAA